MSGTFENLDEMLDNLDWCKLHEDMALTEGYNDQIIIWYDGTITYLDSSSYHRTDDEHLILTTPGRGNVSELDYAEGWAERIDEDDRDFEEHYRDYCDQETGEIMTPEEMICKAIAEGDWDDWIDFQKQRLKEQYHQDYVMNKQ